MAARFSMEPKPFLDTIRQTVFPGGQGSDAQVAAFLAVSHEYGLNPFTREIYAFPSKGGGIVPIVGVDGWIKLANQHPAFDGEETIITLANDGTPVSATCTVWRKDRAHPIVTTEYFSECYRSTEPWNKMPKRMMRNRTKVQGFRNAFGFAGIYDEDEGQNIINVTAESTVMERSTETRTEALKDKIGAKKADKEKKVAEKAPEPVAPPPNSAAPEPEPSPPPEAPPFDPESVQQEIVPDKSQTEISEDDRQKLINILQAKGTDQAKQIAVQKVTRQKLFEMGYANTKKVIYKDLPSLMKWAEELAV